jgi:hypothetical protein
MLNYPGLRLIHLVWEGPKPIEEVYNAMAESDFGVYAIYGTHAITGPDTLMYVGQSNMQQFGGRLRSHNLNWGLEQPTALKVCLGRVVGWNTLTDEQWGVLVDDAEALTIYYTRPAMNCARKETLRQMEPTLVLNHKRRHRLPMCITNISKSLNFADVNFRTYGSPDSQTPQPPRDAIEDEEAGPSGPDQQTTPSPGAEAAEEVDQSGPITRRTA